MVTAWVSNIEFFEIMHWGEVQIHCEVHTSGPCPQIQIHVTLEAVSLEVTSMMGHETLICRHCCCFTGINTHGHIGMRWGAITALLPPSSFPVGNSHIVFVLRRTVVLFPCGSARRKSTCNVGDLGWIPELGRSSGKGKGYSFQCSGLENSMNSIAHGIAKSRTWLSNFHLTSLRGSFPVGNAPSLAEMVAVVVMSYFWGTSLTNTAATL